MNKRKGERDKMNSLDRFKLKEPTRNLNREKPKEEIRQINIYLI